MGKRREEEKNEEEEEEAKVNTRAVPPDGRQPKIIPLHFERLTILLVIKLGG